MSPEFRTSVDALFRMGWTVKSARKAHGHDFKIGRLEGLYWGIDPHSRGVALPEGLRWRLLLRVPDDVRREALREAMEIVDRRRGNPRVHAVTLTDVAEGECVQLLHVGPFGTESESLRLMEEFAHASGRELQGPHHQIYLSDPRRTPPSRLRTILRYPASQVSQPRVSSPETDPILLTP
ncbi:MAG: GyrI-like domain-containing protein [Thermoplasmata archaeon]